MSGETAERLERLERANRRLIAAVGLFATLALVALGVGATRKDPRSLDAGQLILRDLSVAIRARLSADGSGPNLTFLDMDGTEQLRIQTTEDGTSLMTLATAQDAKAPRSIVLRMSKDGWSTLSFSGARGQPRLTVGLGYDAEPRLRMYSRDGKARASLGPDASGRVDFVLYDESGKERALVRLAPDGTPELMLFDEKESKLFHAP